MQGSQLHDQFHQFRAEFKKRSGVDPVKAISPLPPPPPLLPVGGDGSGNQTEATHRAKGLNPFLMWRKEKFESHNAMHAPTGSLTDAERSTLKSGSMMSGTTR